MPLIDIDGQPFYIDESGAGAEALVMHGGPGMDHSYMRGLDVLGDLLRLVYYDHRGGGRSTQEGLDRVTIEMYADDAERIRQALGLGQLVGIGHSHGASVALELVLKYPASVSMLILISGVGTYDYEMSPPQDVLTRLTEEEKEILRRPVTTDEEMLQQLLIRLARTCADQSSVEAIREAFADARCTIVSGQAGEAIADQGWSVSDRLEEIECPVLVIGGDSDWITPPREVEQLALALPRGELVLLDRCGHFPWIEQPAAFFRTVRDFLNRELRPA
ncbi:MAG: alpha/beta fold hydrolase [Actinobacteria bacterium]|nr:alpha/beta fold hydrolase [Actinomycetota bacterium]